MSPPVRTAQPKRQSLLTDELLRRLMGAGQADIVVGIPTLNHADSVGPIARAVNELFTSVYVRERTVLLNPDGGSTDGTREVIEAYSGGKSRDSGAGSELVSAPFALRTVHRISTPYHGVPGRGSALRVIFAAADLLRARAVAVIDPDAGTLRTEDLHRFIQPVFEGQTDYVKPVVPRALADSPLNTQLVRPLLRAMYGVRISEPMDTLMACSGAYAVRALGAGFWDNSYAQDAPEPWLLALGAQSKLRFSEVAMPAPGVSRAYAEFGALFRQVVGAVFASLEETAPIWRSVTGSTAPPRLGHVPVAAAPQRSFDVAGFAGTFREAIEVLKPLLERCVSSSTLGELTAAAHGPELRIDDALWVRTVYEFLATAGRRVMPLSQLVQLLQPLYLGRLGGWLEGLPEPASNPGDELEALALEFERQKPALSDNWGHAGGE